MTNIPEFRHVLVIEDQKSRRIVPLRENSYIIGRDPSCAILLYDRQVSRHHATLLRVNDYVNQHYSYRLIDGDLQGQKSTNGIIVNGRRTTSHELKHGDFIQFGSKAKASYHIISASADLELLKVGQLAPPPLPAATTLTLDPTATYRSDVIAASSAIAIAQEEEMQTSISAHIAESKNKNGNVNDTSLAEYSPYPIIELDFLGQLTYLNPAASIKFPELSQATLDHPLLKDIVAQPHNRDGTSFMREVQVQQSHFEQYIHYFVEQKLIRCYIQEVTRYKDLEQNLNLNQERLTLFHQQGTEGIFLVDIDNKQVVETNQAFCDLLGFNAGELLTFDLYRLIALDREIIDNDLAQVTENHPISLSESLYRCQDGSLINTSVKISQVLYNHQPTYCFAVRNISDRKQTEERLQYETLHDALTQLPNRILFNKQLALALAHAQRHQHLMAVIFLDLDSFKNINNTLGHSIGDQILQKFGQRLGSCVRAGDTIARWGSDEFCLLLPQIKNTEDTVKLAQRIFENLLQPFEIKAHRLYLKSSIGIAVYPQDGEDAETLLKNADTALNLTKQQGKNHYQFYNPHLSTEAAQLLQIENLLHQALDKKQLFLQYQPQINLQTRKIVGIEALLRWQHPEQGLILPHKFLPLAEKTDLMLHIGKWVLKTACEQNKSWQKDGLPPVPIAVNLSAREFRQPNLAEIVARTLDQTHLDPQWLELELTELTLRHHLHLARKTFRDLQQLGVRIALDDYGTGFSALGYLKQFSFNTLKIHQAFIRDLRGNPQENALISAILSIAQGFNFRVVAEGVETDEQLEILRRLNCREIQGYWLSRPLLANDLANWIRNDGFASVSRDDQ